MRGVQLNSLTPSNGGTTAVMLFTKKQFIMRTEKEIQAERKKRTARYIGSAIGITSTILACVCYGWQLSLIIFLALIGNNIEQNNKRKTNEK